MARVAGQLRMTQGRRSTYLAARIKELARRPVYVEGLSVRERGL